jgi:hypothetical protein
LNQTYKNARPTVRRRQDIPSKFSVFDLKGEFGRSDNFSLSSTIGIDRSIFEISRKDNIVSLAKKDRQQRPMGPFGCDRHDLQVVGWSIKELSELPEAGTKPRNLTLVIRGYGSPAGRCSTSGRVGPAFLSDRYSQRRTRAL